MDPATEIRTLEVALNHVTQQYVEALRNAVRSEIVIEQQRIRIEELTKDVPDENPTEV